MQQYYQYQPPFMAEDYLTKQAEKKSIKHLGNAIGATFCLSLFAVVFMQYALIFILGNLLGRADILAELLYSPFGQMIQQTVFSVLMFIPPFIILAKCLRRPLGELVAVERVPAKTMLPLVAVGTMLAMFGNIAAQYVNSFASAFGFDSEPADFKLSGEPAFIVLYIIVCSALPALVEEFALRGVVLGLLRPFGYRFAIVASALTFGVMHGNLVQGMFAFVLGLFLGYVCVVTRSIWPGVMLHFVNNLFSSVISLWSEFGDIKAASIFSSAFFALFMAAGVAGLIYIARKKPELLDLRRDGGVFSLGARLGAFWLTAGMIIFTVIDPLRSLLIKLFLS